MAILNGLIQKMKGSAGQFSFKSLNGQTVVSEKPAKVSTPRFQGFVSLFSSAPPSKDKEQCLLSRIIEFADNGINENHGAPTEIETPWLLVEHLELIALRFQIPETCGESVMEFVY